MINTPPLLLALVASMVVVMAFSESIQTADAAISPVPQLEIVQIYHDSVDFSWTVDSSVNNILEFSLYPTCGNMPALRSMNTPFVAGQYEYTMTFNNINTDTYCQFELFSIGSHDKKVYEYGHYTHTTPGDGTVISEVVTLYTLVTDTAGSQVSFSVLTSGSSSGKFFDFNTYLELSDEFYQPGTISVADADAGSVATTVITGAGSVDPNRAGTYKVEYTVTDNYGRSKTITETVNVSDTVAPTFKVNSHAADFATDVETGQDFTRGVISDIADAGDASPAKSITDHRIQTFGQYGYPLTVHYTVTDSAGNSHTIIESVNVTPDVTHPYLEVKGHTGDFVTHVGLGKDYVMAQTGIVIRDADSNAHVLYDGINTIPGSRSGPTVTTDTIGSYYITYTAVDQHNNRFTITETVIVVDPQTAPVTASTASDGKSIVMEWAPLTKDLPQGARVHHIATVDDVPGGLRCLTSGDVGDRSCVIEGTLANAREYKIWASTYIEFLDGETTKMVSVFVPYYPGNMENERIVVLPAPDTVPPAFKVNGKTGNFNTIVELGNAYVPGVISDIVDDSETEIKFGFLAFDRTTTILSNPGAYEQYWPYKKYHDPTMTVSETLDGETIIWTKDNPVDDSVLGDITVIYAVTDSAGNQSEIRETVSVRDTVPPAFKVNGETADFTTVLELGNAHVPGTISSIVDAGKTVTAIVSKEVGSASASWEARHYGVNTMKVGQYHVKYSVTDRAGHEALIINTVKVTDTVPPSFTVAGHSFDFTTSLKQFDTYTPMTISNMFDLSGTSDVIGSITGQGDVNSDTPNTYSVQYVATDSSGNTRIITETVKVSGDGSSSTRSARDAGMQPPSDDDDDGVNGNGNSNSIGNSNGNGNVNDDDSTQSALSVVRNGDGTATLSWAAQDGIEKYVIKDNCQGKKSKTFINDGTASSHTFEVADEKQCKLHIRSIYDDGSKSPSEKIILKSMD